MNAPLFNSFRKTLAIDLRSLGLFRIVLGVLILTDLILRSCYIEAFYTDQGILPREMIARVTDFRAIWGLHFMSGSLWWQWVLFVSAMIGAVCLSLGFYSRTMAFGLWLFLVSMDNRNLLLIQSCDFMVGLILLWSVFLPIGARFSLDSYHAKNRLPGDTVFSLASVTILMQVVIIYVAAALLKWNNVWLEEGSALYYAFHLDFFLSGFGTTLAPHLIAHTKILSNLVWYWEMFGPFLLIIPIGFPWLRYFAMIGFIVMHMTFAATMSLGLFPIISCIVFLLYIPTHFWEKMPPPKGSPIFESIAQRLSIFYRCACSNLICEKFLKVVLIVLVACSFNRFLLTTNIVYPYPAVMDTVAKYLHLDQNWTMFAPMPSTRDGWISVVGTTKENGHFDLLKTDDWHFDSSKPKVVSQTFPNQYWLRYFFNLTYPPYSETLPGLANYACRRWNTTENIDKKIEKVEILFFEEITPDYKSDGLSSVKRVELLNMKCPDGPDSSGPSKGIFN